MVGSEDVEVDNAIAAARENAADAAPVALMRSGNSVSISIGSGRGHGHVLLVGYDPRHTTKIGRGENRGRTLEEANIVRSLRDVGDYSGAPLKITVPVGLGAEIAVLIQAPNGRILGAARS